MVGFPDGSDSKESACNTGDPCSISGSEISPGEGTDNLLQYSCLGNLTYRGDWWATVHGVAKSWTQLSDEHFHFLRVEMKMEKSGVNTGGRIFRIFCLHLYMEEKKGDKDSMVSPNLSLMCLNKQPN